ncbi:MAG TPA: ABC transporter permease [Thermoanaerobaculia bacterium]|nr:ABC transporter permease [Thermoanaerobaculia bacterium]
MRGLARHSAAAADALLVALHRLLAALRSLRWRLRPSALDERLSEELAHHRRLLREHRRDRELGEPAALRRECRAAYRLPPPRPPGDPRMTPSLHELLAILRGLRRSPLYTLSSVVVLALGAAATLTLFGMIHTVLLEPLPFPDADRLVRVWGINGENRRANHNPLDLFDYAAGAASIEGIVGMTGGSVTWQGEDGALRLDETVATTGWLGVLGVEPLLGRGFLPNESLPGQDAVVVISHPFWRIHLGGDPGILGHTLVLDDLAHTIVGVLPPDFVHPLAWDSRAVVRPLTVDPENTSRGGHYLQAIARLAPGATPSSAQAELEIVAQELERQHPTTNRERSAHLVPLREGVVGDVEGLLAILSVGVAVLLLITAANVGALFLTRTLDRGDELALRAALGAGRVRLLATLAFEGLVIALLGTGGGIALAWVLRDATAALGLSRLPWAQSFQIDGATIGFALALAVFTAAVLTLPALVRLASREVGQRPADPHRVGAGRRAMVSRRTLVTCQVGLSLVLLFTAGLLTESLDRLLAVDAGFDRAAVATGRISLPEDRYGPAQRLEYFESLRARILGAESAAAKHVESFGMVNRLPLSDTYSCDSFIAGGRPLPEPGAEDCAEDRVVDWGYFEAMGIQLLEGRELAPEDREGRAPVVVVNRTLARRYWPETSAVGQRLRWGGPTSDTPWQEIVGVVADVRHFGLDDEIRPEIYTNHRQNLWSESFWVTMRTDQPEAAVARLREAAAELDPAVPVFDVRTMEERVLGSVESERLRSLLLRLFAGAAVILTAVGLWGLIAYATTQARRELGVRLALGADRARILGWVLGEGLRPIVIGAALGLIGAWAAGRLLAGELFDVPATHVPTLVGALLLLGVVGLAATLGPALRALRLDPMTALREE